MFVRSEIKENARMFLKGRYFKLIVIVFLILFFSASISSSEIERMFGYENFYGEDVGNIMDQAEQEHKTTVDKLLEKTPLNEKFNLEYITADILARPLKKLGYDSLSLNSLFPFLLSLFITVMYIPITALIQVGAAKIFISEKKAEDIKIQDLFLYFKSEDWWNIIKSIVIKGLHVIGGLLLFVVPGIILSIEYSLVEYIVAEDPSIEAKDAMKLSSKMTNGYKWDILKLGLSMIGWYIIMGLFGKLGNLVVMPYLYSVSGELYLQLKSNYESIQMKENEAESDIEILSI